MYGMVNNAFRQYVMEREGEGAWNDIVAKAELEIPEFGAMMPYDDTVTLAIVGAIASRSGQDVEKLLRDVGRFWVAFARSTPFAGLLAMAGRDFQTLVGNLDDMHAKIKASLPTLRPPSFACHRRADGLLEITYQSEREGLFPFVEGIFEGLAADFGEELEVVDFEPLSLSSARWILAVTAKSGEAA